MAAFCDISVRCREPLGMFECVFDTCVLRSGGFSHMVVFLARKILCEFFGGRWSHNNSFRVVMLCLHQFVQGAGSESICGVYLSCCAVIAVRTGICTQSVAVLLFFCGDVFVVVILRRCFRANVFAFMWFFCFLVVRWCVIISWWCFGGCCFCCEDMF